MTKYIKTKPSNKRKKSTDNSDLWGLIGATALAVAVFGAMMWFMIAVLVNGAA